MHQKEQTPIFTESEKETMEWLALVGDMKIKELENEPDTHKPLLYQHKENILNIFTKVLQYSK